jgi:uncharacterized membrane protein (UPF0127 family)
MKSHARLVNRDTGEVVVERLEIADTYWRRLAGLQFRRELQAGHGLLLVPCSSIHTCFMRFAIDLVAIDQTGEVAMVRHDVRPWRAVAVRRGTRAVLELPRETAVVRSGDRLRLVTDELSQPIRRPILAFLL